MDKRNAQKKGKYDQKAGKNGKNSKNGKNGKKYNMARKMDKIPPFSGYFDFYIILRHSKSMFKIYRRTYLTNTCSPDTVLFFLADVSRRY